MWGDRDQRHAQLLGAASQVVQHTLAVALLEVVLPLIGVFLPLGQHGVDQPGEFVDSGGDGLWFVHGEMGSGLEFCQIESPRHLKCLVFSTSTIPP